MATKVEMRIALALVGKYKANYAAYLRDCEDDRERGYRSHFCEHGTNQWTDYDNICGGCESGMTLRGIGAYEAAMGEAYSIVWEATVRNVTMELYARTRAGFDMDELQAFCDGLDGQTLEAAWRGIIAYHREVKESVRV